MTLVRFTVIDAQGAASFVGPGHAIKMFAAACSRNPRSLAELLEFTRPYDADFITEVRNGLAVFDEHNTPDDPSAFHSIIEHASPSTLPPFRVLDEVTRDLSLQPVESGLILYNLGARRIVQVVNSYGELQREDRGRIRRSGQPTRMLYHYRLPDEWAIVP
ncbi:hypothetical protein NET02_02445 [Thermomicrobiaceae bacterium CFH 74404]|uniref:Uncharacterized protein n=2 Tax=Thermomicrobia TaxID=189775 RepID=A0AA41W9W4_9BACT|nr:hypothetical protein [Thermalbibacter longus]MCM8748001.1 hypothetical protein [Thermalbibacter longus]